MSRIDEKFDAIFGVPMAKAGGGPFIGPNGGKWADAKHTIHWDPKVHESKPDPGRPGKALVDGVDTIEFDTAEGRAKYQLTLKPDGSNRKSWEMYHAVASKDHDKQIADAMKQIEDWKTKKWDSSMYKKKDFLETRDREIQHQMNWIEHINAIKSLKAKGEFPPGPSALK